MTTKFYTLEEAAKIAEKSIRTIRRHIDKLDKNSYDKYVKFDNNKLFVSDIFIDKMIDKKKIVTPKNVTVKTDESAELKRQILRLEKKLDEKEAELKNANERHIEDLKILTAKVLYLEESKSKQTDETKANLEKIEAEKNNLAAEKIRLEEQLKAEKEKLALLQNAPSPPKSPSIWVIVAVVFLVCVITWGLLNFLNLV